MRIRAAALASLVFQLSMFASDSARAQTDAGSTAFLDFGVPCEDPLPESDLPKPLNGSVTLPSSDPSKPLSAPDFPPVSRRLSEEGTAVLRLLIAETGAVSQAHILKSTGSPRLDNAALEVTRKWHMRPGKVQGKPRCMWGKFAVSFVLTDYPQNELEQVNVSPQARELAHHLMNIEPLKEALLTSEGAPTAVAREMINLTVNAALAHSSWAAAEDKVARIVAMEFTPDELAELSKFFGSPVAAKWTSLNFKMMPAIAEEQRLVGQTLACSIYSIDTALKAKDAATIQVDGALTEKYRQAIPAFVERSIPFCACAFKNQRAAAGGRVIAECGLPPALE